MATVSWDEFFYLVTPYLPGAPDATVRIALRDTTAEFLARTHLWREEVEPFTTEAGTADYELYGSALIEAVLRLTLDGNPLDISDERLVDPSYLLTTSKPTGFWLRNDTAVRLFPTPDAVYEIGGLVALKPTRLATGVERWIFESWADAIVSGVIYRLASIPNKGWSDQALAMLERQRFDRAIANAKNRDLRQIPLRVRARPF